MGIRIRKILGYGWDDFEGFDKDPRIKDNWKDKNYNHNSFTYKGFLEYCEKRLGEIREKYPKEEDRMFIDEYFSLLWISRGFKNNESSYKELDDDAIHYDSISYDEEFGYDNVIVFTIPWQKDWYRYDDIIDYYQWHKKSIGPHVKVINRPIYPYDFYINSKTGNRVKFEYRDTYSFLNDLIKKEKDEKRKLDLKLGLEKVCKEAGFDGTEDASKHFVPGIAEDVRLIIDYFQIFKNPLVVHTLKPMIYTYWA